MSATLEELKPLVERNHVCYEVWPEYLRVGEKTVAVGFQLELLGTAPRESKDQPLEWSETSRTFGELRTIAEWIMPREMRPSRYEIDPWDGALHATPKRGFRPEVSLTIRVLHRLGFDQPVDDCEKRCLKEMRDRLAELGVSEGRSQPDRSPTDRARRVR